MTNDLYDFEDKFHQEATLTAPQCYSCVHWKYGTSACRAYPEGILQGIMSMELDHSKPLPGDSGVVFTAKVISDLSGVDEIWTPRAPAFPALDDSCSKHFKYRDFIECGETQARTELPNLPREVGSYLAIKELATHVLDAVWERYGPVRLTYGFSSRELLKLIPGRIAPERDQHAAHERKLNGKLICERLGAACDFLVEGENMREVAEWVFKNTKADRIYFYGDHSPVHVSYFPKPTRQFIEMLAGKTGKRTPKVIRIT